MIPTSLRLCSPLLCLLMLGGCKTAAELLYEPKPTDPLDGYAGTLAQAGNNTEMDWGPKQGRLLEEFKTLKEEHALLKTRLENVTAEKDNLKSQLGNETRSLDLEQRRRAEIEAQFELKNQKLREQEATILSLRIEKAKLEQANLVTKIEALKQAMAEVPGPAVEAATPPSGRR